MRRMLSFPSGGSPSLNRTVTARDRRVRRRRLDQECTGDHHGAVREEAVVIEEGDRHSSADGHHERQTAVSELVDVQLAVRR